MHKPFRPEQNHARHTKLPPPSHLPPRLSVATVAVTQLTSEKLLRWPFCTLVSFTPSTTYEVDRGTIIILVLQMETLKPRRVGCYPRPRSW